MDCNDDAACDGVMTVPNDAHTACGEQNGNLFTKINVKEWQTPLLAHDELIWSSESKIYPTLSEIEPKMGTSKPRIVSKSYSRQLTRSWGSCIGTGSLAWFPSDFISRFSGFSEFCYVWFNHHSAVFSKFSFAYCVVKFPLFWGKTGFKPIRKLYEQPIISVCGAGFYISGSVCTMCPGNEIKTMTGDALDCSADPPCDGVTQKPNDQHTECGLYSYQSL